MSNRVEVWQKAIDTLNRYIEQKVEIYDYVRIFNPMHKESRSRLTCGDMNITAEDISECDKAVERYNSTLSGMVEKGFNIKRRKRSSFYKEMSEYYEKNK